MTNDELDAACAKVRNPQPPGWGASVAGAVPTLRLEPGKSIYAFDPGCVVEKLTVKKRSNWRIEVKLVTAEQMTKFRLLTPNGKGTTVAAHVDMKAKTLTVYPIPVDPDELEIEYAAAQEVSTSPSTEGVVPGAATTTEAKRPTLTLSKKP